MKMFSALLAASVISVAMVGCNNPHREDPNAPMIHTEASRHTMMTGETTRVVAHTMNLVGVNNIKWSVSPTTGTITPDKDGLTATFGADEPGTYLITAAAQKADGQWVSSDAHITVNGMKIRNDHNGNHNK